MVSSSSGSDDDEAWGQLGSRAESQSKSASVRRKGSDDDDCYQFAYGTRKLDALAECQLQCLAECQLHSAALCQRQRYGDDKLPSFLGKYNIAPRKISFIGDERYEKESAISGKLPNGG